MKAVREVPSATRNGTWLPPLHRVRPEVGADQAWFVHGVPGESCTLVLPLCPAWRGYWASCSVTRGLASWELCCPPPTSAASPVPAPVGARGWGCPGITLAAPVATHLLLGTPPVLRRVRTKCTEISHNTHHRVPIWPRLGFPREAPPRQWGSGWAESWRYPGHDSKPGRQHQAAERASCWVESGLCPLLTWPVPEQVPSLLCAPCLPSTLQR